jgi:predicted patatin/cPLA2 family phospholipase
VIEMMMRRMTLTRQIVVAAVEVELYRNQQKPTMTLLVIKRLQNIKKRNLEEDDEYSLQLKRIQIDETDLRVVVELVASVSLSIEDQERLNNALDQS